MTGPGEQHALWLGGLVEAAAAQPDGCLVIREGAGGHVVATVQAHRTAVRPKDMPRRLRPKRKLSKRQRDAAKRARLGLS